jgi:hypothetical protein
MTNAHQRDPVGGEWWFFVDHLIEGDGEKDARRFTELALRYQVSFQGILNMIVEALKEHYDLARELDAMRKEIKRDADLFHFELPIAEALAIWERSREGLLRLAELFPEKREKFEAAVVEHQDALLALLERYERKHGAN